MAALFQLLDSFRTNRRDEVRNDSSSTPRIGVALSSGGAKGLAHIGAIQVLEESGIPITGIAGTSMGAYVGGLWASGKSGAELEELAADMVSKRDLWGLVDPVFPPRRGFLRGNHILERLEKTLEGKAFSDLEVPFLAVATELETLERVIFDEGNVASAIVASLAVPGVVVPVTRNGIEYIDGGVSDPLPVRVSRETWDLDAVIAINVLPPVGSLRRRKEPGPKRGWRRGLEFANRHLNYFARGNLLDTLRNAAMGSQMRLVGRSAKQADVLISALRPESGWHDYHNYRDYIEVGREAAERALPQIEALLEPATLNLKSEKAS